MGTWFVFLFANILFFNSSNAEVIDLQLGQPADSQSRSGSHRPYVDTLIVVAVDVSGSVDKEEYQIQKDGIVKAFSDPQVQNLLRQCSSRGIGVTYVEWSGQSYGPGMAPFNPFVQVIPWTHLLTPQDMDAFANQILTSPRSSQGETDIARALDFSKSLLLSAPFESDNKIVSLSTDGRQGRAEAGISAVDLLAMARDRLAGSGVTINAIGIEVEFEADPRGGGFVPVSEADISLGVYLNNYVRTGERSFVESVKDFEAYSEVFKKQLTVMMNACIS